MRTFLALDLDVPIRQRLLAVMAAVGDGGAKMKWVDDGQLHITLKFLGDVPDRLIHDVCSIVADVADNVDHFEFQVKDLLCVPSAEGPIRMIWAGVIDPTGRMGALHEQLDLALAGLGLKEEERSFKPHITMARVKYARDPSILRRAVQRRQNEDFGLQHADEVVIYSSALTPDGPVYTPIARAALA